MSTNQQAAATTRDDDSVEAQPALGHISLDEGVDALLNGIGAAEPEEGDESLPEGKSAGTADADDGQSEPEKDDENLSDEGEEEDGEGEGEEKIDDNSEEKAGDESDAVTLSDLAEELEVDVADLQGVGIPVKVNGEESTVPLADLVKNYQIDGAAQVKMQEAAETAKEATTARNAYRDALATRFSELDQVLTVLSANIQVAGNPLEGIDPDEDPGAYLKAQREYSNNQQLIQRALHEQQVMAQQHQEIAARDMQEWVEAQEPLLLDLIPEWRDPKVRSKGEADGRALLTDMGFSTEEIEGLQDAKARAVVALAVKGKGVSKKASALTREIKKGNLKGRLRGRGRQQPGASKRAASRKLRSVQGGGTIEQNTDALVALMQSIDGDG